MIFTTSTDKIVRNKTIGVFLLFTTLYLPNLIVDKDGKIFFGSVYLFFMLIMLYTYLNKPIKFILENNQLTIRRFIGNISIDFQDISRVDRIHHDLLKDAIKGGAFGYFGKHHTDLGPIKFYATRRDQLVMLTKKDKSKIIITPDQEDLFIESLEKKLSTAQQSHL